MGLQIDKFKGLLSHKHKANEVKITDAGGYYTGTEVETALQEIGAGTTLDSRYVNVSGDTMSGALTIYNGTDAIKSGTGYPLYRKSYNSASYTEPTLDDYGTMVFYYKMNEGTGTTLEDQTTNNNDATLAIGQTSGAVPTWTTDPNGTANSALDFITGKAYVSTAWRPTSSFTICTVMKFDNLYTSTAGKYSQIFANWKYVNSNDKNGFSLRYQYNGDNNLSFYITNGGATEATASVSHSSAGLNTTDWFHIAIRFNDTTNEASVWVNGVKKATATFSTTVGYVGTEIFTIGALGTPYTTADSVNYCGDFKMNWVAAYSEALTDLEIYQQAVATLGLGFTAEISDTNSAVATAGKIHSWKSAGVEKAYMNGDGAIYTPTILDSNGNEAIKLVTTTSAVNELTVTPGATGSGVTLSATGDDTNINLILTPKGTGSVILPAGAATNPSIAFGSNLAGFYEPSANHIGLATAGAMRFRFYSGGMRFSATGAANFEDNNGNELLKFSITASAVNELTITNAATGSSPILSATGGDTNIGLDFTAKGTGAIQMNSQVTAWQNILLTRSATATSTASQADSRPLRLQVGGWDGAAAWNQDTQILNKASTSVNKTYRLSFYLTNTSAVSTEYLNITNGGGVTMITGSTNQNVLTLQNTTLGITGRFHLVGGNGRQSSWHQNWDAVNTARDNTSYGTASISLSTDTTDSTGGIYFYTGTVAAGTPTVAMLIDQTGKITTYGNAVFGDASTDTYTFTGRMIPRTLGADPTVSATAGTLGEIAFYNDKWYGKTVGTGTDTNWSALN